MKQRLARVLSIIVIGYQLTACATGGSQRGPGAPAQGYGSQCGNRQGNALSMCAGQP